MVEQVDERRVAGGEGIPALTTIEFRRWVWPSAKLSRLDIDMDARGDGEECGGGYWNSPCSAVGVDLSGTEGQLPKEKLGLISSSSFSTGDCAVPNEKDLVVVGEISPLSPRCRSSKVLPSSKKGVDSGGDMTEEEVDDRGEVIGDFSADILGAAVT